MKLDYKKTIYVGMAFFIISMFWITYDNIIAKMLIDKFGLTQRDSGIIMALDNILALALLPLFGMLSDKTKSKYGKRTPYIVIGTLVAVVAFMTLSFVDQSQTNKIKNETEIITQYEEINKLVIDENGNSITLTRAEWDQVFDNITSQNIITSYDKIVSKYALNDKLDRFDQRDVLDVYYTYLSEQAFELTKADKTNLILFIVILFIVLFAMSTFRSPAVALMPDVTLKPLRSKANAVINLLGAIGGIISTGLLLVLGLSKASYVPYTSIFIITGVLMLIGLAIFLFKVNETRLLEEHALELKKYDIQEEVVVTEEKTIGKLPKGKFISLILILTSVFFWFTGYNAITSKLSDYAPKMLNMDFATPLIIAQATAIIAFIPIGILSSKFGRKKMILAGVTLLTACFFAGYFLDASTGWVIYIILGLTGVAWATINVNSFPMVVELATGSDVGKYTGYYYTFSMAAQIMTPILSGTLMAPEVLGRAVLFPYATFFVALSFITMLFVKHGDVSAEDKKSLLEHFDVD